MVTHVYFGVYKPKGVAVDCEGATIEYVHRIRWLQCSMNSPDSIFVYPFSACPQAIPSKCGVDGSVDPHCNDRYAAVSCKHIDLTPHTSQVHDIVNDRYR